MRIWRGRSSVPHPAVAVLVSASLLCCTESVSSVRLRVDDTVSVPLVVDRTDAANGLLKLEGKGAYTFQLEAPIAVPANSALELDYSVLPLDGSSLELYVSVNQEPEFRLPLFARSPLADTIIEKPIRFQVPIFGAMLNRFSIRYSSQENTTGTASIRQRLVFMECGIGNRVYGYEHAQAHTFLTPFVQFETVAGMRRITIGPVDSPQFAQQFEVDLRGLSPGTRITAGDSEFRITDSYSDISERVQRIPAGVLVSGPDPFRLEADTFPSGVLIRPTQDSADPQEPILIDPGLLLTYDANVWRNPRYEVFRWQSFPAILMFDTIDYEVQDRFFKRLAFFVEKAGFRGALASDAQIANLHGWNAHDYRADDLAAFFETARKDLFPLNEDERTLQEILIATGIINVDSDGTILPGFGAIVSISKESSDQLRNLFIIHECFHGLFFIDEDFRNIASTFYDQLDERAKRFLLAYFDSRRYDIRDRHLMINELMAYCLQQPLTNVGMYFGQTLPVRLENDARRKQVLPQKEEGLIPYPTLSAAFETTSRRFDAYVKERYGLEAGRVASIYQISRTNAAR